MEIVEEGFGRLYGQGSCAGACKFNDRSIYYQIPLCDALGFCICRGAIDDVRHLLERHGELAP
eukprot:5701629-Karenia_brevis.AAC.1